MASPIFGDAIASRYEVQQQLAKKYGRRTLLARDLTTQELVVIKILSFSPDFTWDDLKLFEREAELLKTLSHPAIPRYLDYFELDHPSFKGFALVQTYIPAKSLAQLLNTGTTFSETEVEQIARALLEILLYLHKHQPAVIHRDIKPSNILLARSENQLDIYLVDFGSVQIAAREGGTMTIVGTYGYMPPEQFGDRAVPASDIYSLGATLIALVTGMHPADLPYRDGRIQFDHIATLSPAFNRWLKRMTEPSLERRFGRAAQALQALSQPILSGSTAIASRQPARSNIVLHKNAETLEIIMPPKGFSIEIVGLGLFAIAWNSFLVLWTGGAVFMAPFPVNLVFGLFSLPFWGVGIGMIGLIVAGLYQQVRLKLDAQQIRLSYEMWGKKYHQRIGATQEIFRLQCTPRFYRRDSEGDRVEVKPQLNIWVGTQKYELGANGLLSEPEIDWLAQELSDWLDIAITKE